MRADLLRQAASEIRAEWSPQSDDLFCSCEDSDHWFDRSICPEPCDSMHDICVECGRVKGFCAVAIAGRDNGNRLAKSWLAVADWLDAEADANEQHRASATTAGLRLAPALAVARAYIGGAS